MTAGYVVFCGLLGLIIGSFLNVVIYRVPRGQSISVPRSHCTACGHVLRPWELIPVLSYLLLNGRCAKCGKPISMRYPGVELLTGGLFALTVMLRPERSITGQALDMVLVALLIALSFIDWDVFRLPDPLVILVAVSGAASTLLTGEPGWWNSLVGSLGVGAIFALVAFFYPQGMGWGDVKLVAALGLYLGSPNVFISIFVASVLGILVGGGRILFLKKGIKEPIPFGPFLAAGALIVLWIEPYLYRIFG